MILFYSKRQNTRIRITDSQVFKARWTTAILTSSQRTLPSNFWITSVIRWKTLFTRGVILPIDKVLRVGCTLPPQAQHQSQLQGVGPKLTSVTGPTKTNRKLLIFSRTCTQDKRQSFVLPTEKVGSRSRQDTISLTTKCLEILRLQYGEPFFFFL